MLVRLDRDRAIALLAVQDDGATSLLAGVDEAARLDSWWLVLPDGTRHDRGAAVPPLLEELARARRLARVTGLVPAAVFETAYDLVARYRSLLGRLVPDGPAPRRIP